MDHRASAGILDERDVLGDGVIGLHLEAVPVGPHHRADVVLTKQVGDLVSFDRVMEGGDVVAKLLRHIDHVGHLVGAIAVVLNEILPSRTPFRVSIDASRSGMSPPLA